MAVGIFWYIWMVKGVWDWGCVGLGLVVRIERVWLVGFL